MSFSDHISCSESSILTAQRSWVLGMLHVLHEAFSFKGRPQIARGFGFLSYIKETEYENVNNFIALCKDTEANFLSLL